MIIHNIEKMATYTFYGRVEYIDGKKIKINTSFTEKASGSYNTVKHLASMKRGFHPLRRNGFFIERDKHTRIFNPTFTKDPNTVKGMDVEIECELKNYSCVVNNVVNVGWKFVAITILLKNDDQSN